MVNHTKQLQETFLAAHPGGAALIQDPNNRRYFTGFPSSEGLLVITAEDAFLLVDFRYVEAAAKQAVHCQVLEFSNMAERLKALLKDLGCCRVFVEDENISLSRAKQFQNCCEELGIEAVLDEALDKAVMALRMIKSPDEVAKLEAAQAITDEAFTHILRFIRPGVTEKEIALELEFYMRRHGADGNAFDPIVAAGKNGSMCHAVPSDYVVQKGDLVTMDFGALLAGYHADMTRTVAVGEISPEQRKVYDTVLEAHNAARRAAKPGVPCRDIDKLARDIIDREYEGRFGHGLGHGVGLEIHEQPRFSRLDETLCAPGMVITDEPGIYLPDQFGVRIEDMLLITEDGCRSLTKSKKELIQL